MEEVLYNETVCLRITIYIPSTCGLSTAKEKFAD